MIARLVVLTILTTYWAYLAFQHDAGLRNQVFVDGNLVLWGGVGLAIFWLVFITGLVRRRPRRA